MTARTGSLATFVVDRIPRQVWDALAVPAVGETFVLPGFSAQTLVLERDPERLLRGRDPGGAERLVRLEPVTAAGWPTRVAVSQPADRCTPEVWQLCVADLQLFLEREIDLAAQYTAVEAAELREVGFGLEVVAIEASSRLGRAGLAPGDVILTFGGVRTLNRDAALALLQASSGASVAVTWARGQALHEGEVAG